MNDRVAKIKQRRGRGEGGGGGGKAFRIRGKHFSRRKRLRIDEKKEKCEVVNKKQEIEDEKK